MTTKQHKHKIHSHKTTTEDHFTHFIQKEMEKSLIELVITKSWSRSYIALGKIKTLVKLIEEAQKTSGKKFHQTISVTFRRMK